MKIIRDLCKPPVPEMSTSIQAVRALGQHGLADKLTRLRDEWARTVAQHADAIDAVGTESEAKAS